MLPKDEKINQRVVMWARATGASLEKIAESDFDEPYMIGNCRWTIAYINWSNGMWAKFRTECHGDMLERECCIGASMDGRYDLWLYKEVMNGKGSEKGSA